MALSPFQEKKVVILYKRNAEPDAELLRLLKGALSPPEYDVFIDKHLKIGVEWARVIEEKIREADVVIALLSDIAVQSEMLEYEIEIALDEILRSDAPLLLPVRVGSELPAKGTVGELLNSRQYSVWLGKEDNSRVLAEIVDALSHDTPSELPEFPLGLTTGSVPSESPLYIARSTDTELERAIEEHEGIVLVKGPRQVGKTSLIGRGVRWHRQRKGRCVTSDFQRLASVHLRGADDCYRIIAADLARQMKFSYDFNSEWLPMFGAESNLHSFLRSLVASDPGQIVWFMDEVDRLFNASFSGDFFALVRSWHNARMMEPAVGWERLSIVITYATEAHLFIQDLNQSPFNVGRQLTLRNFTFDQVAELNDRYGRPLRNVDQLQWLYELIEGHPFLTRRALDYLVRSNGDLRGLMDSAVSNEGPFGDHLKRILVSIHQLSGVLAAMRDSLSNVVLRDSVDVQRLLAAGILVRRPDGNFTTRCKLYRLYLAPILGSKP